MGRRRASDGSSGNDASLINLFANGAAGIMPGAFKGYLCNDFLGNASNVANAVPFNERYVCDGEVRRVRATRQFYPVATNRYRGLTREDRLTVERARGSVVRQTFVRAVFQVYLGRGLVCFERAVGV